MFIKLEDLDTRDGNFKEMNPTKNANKKKISGGGR